MFLRQLASNGLRKALFAGLLGLAVVASVADALAASSPFGIATPDTSGGSFGGPLAPVFTWIAQRQAEFYRVLTTALAEIKKNGWATWLLLFVSFAYGVFHAAGPGHGKAVISAYVLSTGERVRHGVMVSFAAAFVQAFTAIAIVAVAAMVFRVTARSMTVATEWVEIASYTLITAVGVWLVWQKVFGRSHHHHHHSTLDDNGQRKKPQDEYNNRKNMTAERNIHPSAEAKASRRELLRVWSAILAVGIRPCSGAIIVLVFALAQGLFAAGIAAALAMAVGTGVTVALLATLAVSAKGVAIRLTETNHLSLPASRARSRSLRRWPSCSSGYYSSAAPCLTDCRAKAARSAGM